MEGGEDVAPARDFQSVVLKRTVCPYGDILFSIAAWWMFL